MAMTALERWLAVLDRQKPDRVPLDYHAVPEVTEKLMRHLGCATEQEMFRRLHIDYCPRIIPPYIGPPLPANENEFAMRFTEVENSTGAYDEVTFAPLAQYDSVEAIEANYTWPSPDWYDYAALPAMVDAWPDHPIRCYGSEPFGTYRVLRGDEQAFIDFIDHPDIVEYCMGKLFDMFYEKTLRTCETLGDRITMISVSDDLGSQHGLSQSLSDIRRFIVPGMKRMIELARQAGLYVFHHDDGGIRDVIPDLIDMGVNILDPVQWRCAGMDREGLKRDFGDDLIFHGAVDNQYTLAFGSTDEVRAEVEENIRILGAGGGYIPSPCHTIQTISPIENILAMYEAGYECGGR